MKTNFQWLPQLKQQLGELHTGENYAHMENQVLMTPHHHQLPSGMFSLVILEFIDELCQKKTRANLFTEG